jgi:nucleoside-diphosphate-sugar epimerase
MTTVLVTGAAGYIGSVLCEHLLDAGHSVIALDALLYRRPSLLHLAAHERFEFVDGDVRDEELMHDLVKRADVIVPLAAIVGTAACDRDPWLARAVNVDAIALVNRLRSSSQLMVFPATNRGYGARSGETYCTEDTSLEPISLYGCTKVWAETLVLDTPNAITLRLATVFGISPRMRLDLLVNHFVWSAVTDGYIVLFEKDFKRNHVHVRDVADCIVHCIEHADHMVGQPYNVGLESANLTKEELALKVKEYVPGVYLHVAPVGSDPDQRNYIVSSERLRKAGFTAKRSLDAGIVELRNGYRMLRPEPSWNA